MLLRHEQKYNSDLFVAMLWVTWRHFLVYDQRFGIICLSHLQGLRVTTQKILSNITTTAEAFNYI
jgi:hypothetical protein